MELIKYVDSESVVRAKMWEERFRDLPVEAGIIFIGVEAVPLIGGKSDTYDVRLGISARFETDTGLAVIKKVLANEMGKFVIRASVFRGSSGKYVG